MTKSISVYLEDLDLGYRARIAGYENWYLPEARVFHVGSGTSGSRYNEFKIRYSSRNNIYMIWKNMPLFSMDSESAVPVAGLRSKAAVFLEKRIWKRVCGRDKKRLLHQRGSRKTGGKK